MFVVYKRVAQRLDRLVIFNANHKALAAHVHNVRIGLLQLFKLLHQVSAHLGSIVHKLLVLNHVEHRQSRRTCQVVAAKGSA